MSSNECCSYCNCCSCKICQTKNLQNNMIQDPNCSCRMTLDDFVKIHPGMYPGVISNPIAWVADLRYQARYLFSSRPLEEQFRIMMMFSEKNTKNTKKHKKHKKTYKPHKKTIKKNVKHI